MEARCPKRLLSTLRRDFQTITEAKCERAAQRAYDRFVREWGGKCEGMVASLKEAGEKLLTYYHFPRSQWRTLRTTNMIERLHEEFRRRLRTQCSLPTEASALYLLYGVYASGQIRMRRIDGAKDLPKVLAGRMGTAARRAT